MTSKRALVPYALNFTKYSKLHLQLSQEHLFTVFVQQCKHPHCCIQKHYYVVITTVLYMGKEGEGGKNLLTSILMEIPNLNTKNKEIPILKNTVSLIIKKPHNHTQLEASSIYSLNYYQVKNTKATKDVPEKKR